MNVLLYLILFAEGGALQSTYSSIMSSERYTWASAAVPARIPAPQSPAVVALAVAEMARATSDIV